MPLLKRNLLVSPWLVTVQTYWLGVTLRRQFVLKSCPPELMDEILQVLPEHDGSWKSKYILSVSVMNPGNELVSSNAMLLGIVNVAVGFAVCVVFGPVLLLKRTVLGASVLLRLKSLVCTLSVKGTDVLKTGA